MSASERAIRILVVDDHPLLRSGINALLADQPDTTVVAEGTTGQDAVRQFRAHRPDITLMDLQMPEMNGLDAISLVHAGHKRIVPEVATTLAEHAADESLSLREIEVLRLIAGGNANKVIAAELSITEETVKGHVSNILAKLAANDRTHAVTIGLKRGIIDL